MLDQELEVCRELVRPGLTMVKRRIWKEDGRYLIYFDFERDAAVGTQAEGVPASRELAGTNP